MTREIHVRFFFLLGLLLGALYGFLFSVWTPTRTVSITDLYSPVMWAIAILSFFVLQFSLGVALSKPSISREVYLGLLVIPIIYTTSAMTIMAPNFFQTLIAVEIPALILFIASFYLISPLISFFAGFDTKALDNEKIPGETVFSFDIQTSSEFGYFRKRENSLKLLARIVHGIGYRVLIRKVDHDNGLMICRKEKLHTGIFYEFKNRGIAATFIPFRIINDKVKKVEDLDVILDLKAQISGMLYAWIQNGLILRFNEIHPNLELGFRKVAEGLGPLEKPIILHLKETVVSFPKDHPYRFALLTSGLVIIINVTLFILGKLVLA